MKIIQGKIESPENIQIDIVKYEYLKNIISIYYKHNKEMPEKSWLCQKSSLSENKIEVYFENMCGENFLTKKDNYYVLFFDEKKEK